MTWSTHAIKKIDDQTWLVVMRPPGPTKTFTVFCVTGYAALDNLQLKVFELTARPETPPDPSAPLLIQMELFSATLWAADHSASVESCVDTFVNVRNPQYPIELAYEFGGEVCNTPPRFRITHNEEIH